MNPLFSIRTTPLYRAQKPLRDPAYLRFVKAEPSVVSGKYGCDPCHTGPHGIGQKAGDDTCIPLTRKEHREFDKKSVGLCRKARVGCPGDQCPVECGVCGEDSEGGMSADLHIHVLEGVTEEDVALAESNCVGSKWFNLFKSMMLTPERKGAVHEKINASPNYLGRRGLLDCGGNVWFRRRIHTSASDAGACAHWRRLPGD